MIKQIYFMCLGYYALLDYTTAKSIKGFEANTYYAQPCKFDEECSDFRLICHEIDSVCTCTSFYDWDNETKECQLNTDDLNAWLSEQSRKYETESDIEKNSHILFYVQSIAGLFAIITLCLISVVICSLAFCVFKDKDDEKCILNEEEPNTIISPSTSG